MVNRRRFVYGMVSAGVVGFGVLGVAGVAQRACLPSLRGRLSLDVFRRLRQQTFTALIDGHRVPLVLSDVIDHEPGGGSEQFTLVFQGPRQLTAMEGVCALHHPTAGTVSLYVQPGGSDERSRYLRAPFNMLT